MLIDRFVSVIHGWYVQVYIVFTERQPSAAELSELEAAAAVSSFHHDLLSDLLDDRLVHRYENAHVSRTYKYINIY
jgi:hypothetical protein